jgi:hypothetical protein
MKNLVKKSENKREVKEIIATSKNLFNDENLLNLDLESLDSENIDLLVSELSKNLKQKKESSKDKMYKIEVDKKKRQILRKQRNKFVDNILFFKSQKNEIELKKEIDLFNKFYKETYILNDYSLNSICQNNSDNETKIKVKMFLQIVKSFK